LPDFVTGKRRLAHPPPGDPGTFEPSVLYWFELNRSGGVPIWTAHEIDSTSGVGTQFQIGDVNGDSLLDIVSANKNGVFLFQQAPTLFGDYNGNRIVDAADYAVWRKTLGGVGSGLAADGNNNGEIDIGDYNMWRSNFGLADGASGQLVSGGIVPEPSTVMLLMLVAAAKCATRTAQPATRNLS